MVFKGSASGVAEAAGRVWTFAGREFDESRLELRVDGRPVELELKPLEVLVQLLQHPGEVVSKEQLLDAVWPGLSVVDGSLATAIYKLRKALGDHDSTVVVTVPRVGYRLAGVAGDRASRPSPFPFQSRLEAGDPVPTRENWRLRRPFDASPHNKVWLAQHAKTRELRVFKFVSDAARLKSLKREVTVSRFLRESLGERPDLVRILEWNFEKEPYFLESEYAGPNLIEWAESEGRLANLSMESRVGMVAAIAETVAAAHGTGVLHKDLKPANILVTPNGDGEGQIKLADFGSASLLEPARLKEYGITDLGLTQTGIPNPSLAGTFIYLAPEVLSGNAPTALSDVYALGVILYQFVIGDFRRPLSEGWAEDIDDLLVREDIAACVSGTPARRLASAAELAQRLRDLGRRRTERRLIDEQRLRHQTVERKQAEARIRRPFWVALAGVTALVLAASLYMTRRSPQPTPSSKTVAILPFKNFGNDHSLDFLSLALPDEVATSLGYTRGLSIRPFSAADANNNDESNLQALGRKMKVASLVTGHFLAERDQLQLTLEAIDVDNNRVAWVDTFSVPAGRMIELREKLVARTQGALAAVLGASALTGNAGTHPANEEAYDLYLRGAAVPADNRLNKSAIALLEKSVGLDPSYAPAWFRLSIRYYFEGRYGNGGREMIERYDAAVERAVALDPNYIPAAAYLANDHVERGELTKALGEAEDLLKRRPDSAEAHITRGYVFRYAGLLGEAEQECEVSFSLDPKGTPRHCAISSFLNRHYARAMDYVYISGHSDWASAMAISILLRAGKQNDALRIQVPNIQQWKSFDMLPACAEHKPAPEIAEMAANVQVSEDPEANYLAAANLAYCGQAKEALRFLKLAVQGNYCSYPAMDFDPFFASVRTMPEFAAIRAAGMACQQNFLSARPSN